METDRTQTEITRVLRDLLEGGLLKVPRKDAQINVAAPVFDPSGSFHSWVVPLTVGKKLVAWAQLSSALVLQRFSVFLRREGALHSCPDATDWFNPAVVRQRVIATVGENADLSPPILTFDRDPSRLVWLVEELGGEGQRWFVAGQSVWKDPGIEEVTGGPPLVRPRP